MLDNETTNPEPQAAASIPGRPSNRNVLLALTISFAINVAFWGSLIYWFWENVSVRMQVGGCAVFIVFMVVVHWIGFRLWQRQFVQVPGKWRKMPSTRTALLALTISFVINIALWVSLLYWHWKRDSLYMAVGRCTVFIAFMAGVHFIGYRLWKRQFVQDQGSGSESLSRSISSVYWPPIKTAFLQQGIIAILALLILDGGYTLNVTVIAIVAYWLAFSIIVFRRPDSPTRDDIGLIRYGFLLIFFVVLATGPFVWAALGRM